MSQTTKHKSWTGEEVEVLSVEYEPGRPDKMDRWPEKLRTRKELLNYIASAERYWTGKEGFGSERRKTPA